MDDKNTAADLQESAAIVSYSLIFRGINAHFYFSIWLCVYSSAFTSVFSLPILEGTELKMEMI